MKRVIAAVVAMFTLAVSVEAATSASASVDLNNIKETSEIYYTRIGGTPQDGVFERVKVMLPAYKSAVAFASPNDDFDGINQTQPWQSDDLPTIFTKIHNLASVQGIEMPTKEVFFLALELEDGGYLTIQPMAIRDLMSWIEIKDTHEIEIVCGHIGDAIIEESREVPLFSYSASSDFYGALNASWDDILSDKEINHSTAWRVEKEYPESYKHLGWCSWEQYKEQISEDVLVGAINRLEASEVPVRWVLIDDGHHNQSGKSLIDFSLSKAKLPNGWSPILAQRSEKIKWFGLWHCMYGLQRGISNDHTMEDLAPYMMEYSDVAKVMNGSAEGSKLFFDKLIGSVSQPGFDFAKIDFQTRAFIANIGHVSNPVATHYQHVCNLEALAKERLDGMMNCMALNLPAIFHTQYSATTRVSLDYKLNNAPKAISHIYQSFQNSAWVGQTVWPDHDMFHSSDSESGRMMAISKAFSGAPVYMSDAPENLRAEFILPLAYADGELLRPLAPGVPLPESFFAEALLGGDSYRVIAPMSDKSTAIIAYNISSEYPETLSMSVAEEDYKYADAMVQPYPGFRSLPKEGLAYYDWYEKRGGKLCGEYQFEVKSIEDRLILLSEIESGWAVIGLEDKYLSTVAVESTVCSAKSIEIVMKEAGAVVVYSAMPIKKAFDGKEKIKVEAMGGDIYRIMMNSTNVTLRR